MNYALQSASRALHGTVFDSNTFTEIKGPGLMGDRRPDLMSV